VRLRAKAYSDDVEYGPVRRHVHLAAWRLR